jgi:hypothetical protein
VGCIFNSAGRQRSFRTESFHTKTGLLKFKFATGKYFLNKIMSFLKFSCNLFYLLSLGNNIYQNVALSQRQGQRKSNPPKMFANDEILQNHTKMIKSMLESDNCLSLVVF